MKRIKKIIIKHEVDTYADLSYLGEFPQSKGKYAIEHSTSGREYRYFNADNVENMEQALENYRRMMQISDGEIEIIGIIAEAEIQTSQDGKSWKINTITSGGLWGIESDSDKEYIKSIENEQLEDLYTTLKDLGFTDTDFIEVPIINNN